MEDKSTDFLVDIVNSERPLGIEQILLVVVVIVVIALAITWWLKKK